uniref:kunitz-type protease inhibitor 2 isoform X2 n=1 Tax=Doryrhamphus excisus TaxID=161450 RepID=UPI0025AE04CB|nr:kunitz-type protease inhibitor 2 isoform X2 [Doryrhamphus excisus]
MTMNQVPLRCLLSAVVVFGLVLACEWELNDPKQEVRITDGVEILGWRLADECRQECCLLPDCDIAMLDLRAEGSEQCLLISCTGGGTDACVFQPSTRYEVVGKKKPSHVEEPSEQPEPNDEQGKINNPCHEPMKVGACRAYFPRYYYDVANQTCRMFIYGGCGKNGNNFDTVEDCQATCGGDTVESKKSPRRAQPLNTTTVPYADLAADEKAVTAEVYSERCEALPEVGPCRAAFQHWYYNHEAGECMTFIYGGCRGNKNNYMTRQSCVDACQVSVLPSTRRRLPSRVPEADCVSPPATGHCRAAFPAFYYDPATASCQPFIYGGCSGNGNRYQSAEECMASCGTQGSFDKRLKVRSRWTSAFFVLLAVAAICILLAASLVITMLRRRHLSRSASTVSDKEELLPDGRSSRESLNFPENPAANKA